jgi:hypothetical protein
MSFKEGIASYLRENSASLSDSCREYLIRLLDDDRTSEIAPHITTLVAMWNMAEYLKDRIEQLSAARKAIRWRLLKAFANDVSDWELADILEQSANALRGKPLTMAPDIPLQLVRSGPKDVPASSPWINSSPAPDPRKVVFTINIPLTRQGDQQRRAFIWLLSCTQKWTDAEIATLTGIAFPGVDAISLDAVRSVRRPTRRRARKRNTEFPATAGK